MKLCLTMFWEFFKIALFSVGGGPVMLPYFMALTEKFDWFTMQELTDMIAISQSLPGAMALNVSVYTGVRVLGTFGGIVPALGLAAPSMIITLIIARFLKNFNDRPLVQSAFTGIRPAVTGIITMSVLQLAYVCLVVLEDTGYVLQWKPLALCLVVFGLMQIKRLKKIHPSAWFLLGAAIGAALRF